jgi:hypothetical protein
VKSLIDFLFSNLIPFIIVASVIVRIFMGIKKTADRRKESQSDHEKEIPKKKERPEEIPDAWRLEPDDDDDDDDEPRPVRQPARQAAVPQVFSQPLSAPAVFDGQGFAALPSGPEPSRQPLLSREARQGSSAAARFFRRIDALPPMRQAVILAEILGPPKGMQ